MTRLVVNRQEDLKFFASMIAGETKERILLIESESGMGKSTLLAEFIRLCPDNVLCVTVDYKDGMGMVNTLYHLCWCVGPVGQFQSELRRIVDPHVKIDRNLILGRAHIQVAVEAPDQQTRESHCLALTDAFFSDVKEMRRPMVFIFDTLNKAPPDVRKWLLNTFLFRVITTPGAAAVVAGHPPLQPNLSWRFLCKHVPLPGIREPEEWYDGLRAHYGTPCAFAWVQAYCVCFEGHPMLIRTALEKAIRFRPSSTMSGGGQ